MKSICLVYHDVYKVKPLQGVPRSATIYHVSENTFKQHLTTIISSGLKVITIAEFHKGYEENSIILTFDDGWRGSFDIALPLLREYGLKATFFVTKDFIDCKGFANRDIILQAANEGMEIGVHGTTHRMMSSYSKEEIIWEFKTCRLFLESVLGKQVEVASMPGGDFSGRIISCAKEAGLKYLCTSKPGINKPWQSHFRLGRIAIKDSTSISDIQRYCNYNINKELIRWMIFQVPRCLIGMKNYSLLRRCFLGERKDKDCEIFTP